MGVDQRWKGGEDKGGAQEPPRAGWIGGDGPKADRGVATSVDSLVGAGKSVALRGYSLRQLRDAGVRATIIHVNQIKSNQINTRFPRSV